MKKAGLGAKADNVEAADVSLVRFKLNRLFYVYPTSGKLGES